MALELVESLIGEWSTQSPMQPDKLVEAQCLANAHHIGQIGSW